MNESDEDVEEAEPERLRVLREEERELRCSRE